MPILSKRLLTDVSRAYRKAYALRPRFIDLAGRAGQAALQDPLAVLSNSRRRRTYALQEGINRGGFYVFSPAPGIGSWVIGLEDRRVIHGGLLGGEVRIESDLKPDATLDYLFDHGMPRRMARTYFDALPLWPEARVTEAGRFLHETFYQISGWHADLMKENRLKTLQQEQINQALEDQRRTGRPALYAFEKERALLANIRAGDRNGARRILNEMLATIYMSSPQLAVLRARSVEMMSCLTRAAIEDNPLLEPLIERNHTWTERLVTAGSFEDLSQFLMEALDQFIDDIYLHGANRSNMKVHKALDYISRNFQHGISLSSLAREVGLSASRLSHLVKDLTGKSVLQIMMQVRVQHAQHLLEKTSKSCAEIAYETGFGDQSYFIKHFRRLSGVTPARYRRTRYGGQ